MHYTLVANIQFSGSINYRHGNVALFAVFNSTKELENDSPSGYSIELQDGVCITIPSKDGEMPSLSDIQSAVELYDNED